MTAEGLFWVYDAWTVACVYVGCGMQFGQPKWRLCLLIKLLVGMKLDAMNLLSSLSQQYYYQCLHYIYISSMAAACFSSCE